VTWKLDRLRRNLRHLILTLDELTALGVSFVSLGESLDTTAAGRLQLHILGAFAEFELGRTHPGRSGARDGTWVRSHCFGIVNQPGHELPKRHRDSGRQRQRECGYRSANCRCEEQHEGLKREPEPEVSGQRESSPKGGRLRYVPMTKRLAAALKAHRHLRGPRVLAEADGTPLTQKVVQGFVRRAARRAQQPEGVHILRHTFCSHLAMRGAPARAIQELAGHKDLSTTQRYMHLSPAATVNAIRLLDQGQTVSNFGDILETGESRS
jgi:hypothetical protein